MTRPDPTPAAVSERSSPGDAVGAGPNRPAADRLAAEAAAAEVVPADAVVAEAVAGEASGAEASGAELAGAELAAAELSGAEVSGAEVAEAEASGAGVVAGARALVAEEVAAEVARAVRLAEGPAGVRAVVRAIARAAGSTRAVGRATSLPLPLVAAICGELRTRGVLTTDRPARLTPAGRAAFGEGGPTVTGRCPACEGRGTVLGDEAALAGALAEAAAAVPPVRVELDQTHSTVDTKVRRVLALHDAGALTGRRVLVLGDDDLVSVALGAFAARHGAAAAPASLTVVEVDPALVAYLREQLADAPFPVEIVEHDLRSPLPGPLRAAADTVQTDPPYTVAGAELFLTRAVEALRPGAGADVFLSLGIRRPDETVRLQEIMARLGLAVRSLVPGFNEYVGAGVLGGTSALWHLVTAAPTVSPAAGPVPRPAAGLYTGAGKASRYACAACGEARAVGDGRRWRTIGELKAAGCPSCGGRTFRPQPRPPTGRAAGSRSASPGPPPPRPASAEPRSADPGSGRSGSGRSGSGRSGSGGSGSGRSGSGRSGSGGSGSGRSGSGGSGSGRSGSGGSGSGRSGSGGSGSGRSGSGRSRSDRAGSEGSGAATRRRR